MNASGAGCCSNGSQDRFSSAQSAALFDSFNSIEAVRPVTCGCDSSEPRSPARTARYQPEQVVGLPQVGEVIGVDNPILVCVYG